MTAIIDARHMPATNLKNASQNRLLIVGGTGKTGRRLAARLADRGVEHTLASRSGPARFDWDEPSSWLDAVRGATSLYLTYAPDIAVPGAVESIATFVDLAKSAGVRRIVMLSGRGEAEAQRAESVVQESGLEWTVLRCSWFAQNFSENFFVEGIQSGELVLPVGNIAEPFLDADDIADAAALALTTDFLVGQVCELTGPQLLTFEDAIAVISEATGRPIAFSPTTVEEFASSLMSAGLSPSVTWLLNYLFTEVLDGRNACLTNGVDIALGRSARDFASYARATAATGVWNARNSAAV